jgi:hypothetical protein
MAPSHHLNSVPGQSVFRPLHEDWSFTQIGGGDGTQDGEWLPVTNFPTSVHVELLKLKRIADPFVGLNEWEVQCMRLTVRRCTINDNIEQGSERPSGLSKPLSLFLRKRLHIQTSTSYSRGSIHLHPSLW